MGVGRESPHKQLPVTLIKDWTSDVGLGSEANKRLPSFGWEGGASAPPAGLSHRDGASAQPDFGRLHCLLAPVFNIVTFWKHLRNPTLIHSKILACYGD